MLSTSIAKKIYVTNDSTTEFSFPYKFFETSDLVVTLYTVADGTSSVMTEGDDYTVTGTDDGAGGTTNYSSGGTVTLTTAAGDGYKLIIERTVPLTQETDFAPNGPFSEDDFEDAIDRAFAILQQQQSIIDRCIKMDKSFSSVTDAFTTEDVDVSVDDFVIDELTAKTTIGSSDYVAISDGDASNVNKKILASSIININGLTEDTALHANDVFLFEDSQASYAKKKVKRNNLVNINSLTEKETLVANDLFIIEDSADSNAKKKVKQSNLISIASQAQGDIIYYNGSAWTRLGAGTDGKVLKTSGAAANPAWEDELNTSNVLFSFALSGGGAANTNGLIVNDSQTAASTEIQLGYWAVYNNTYRTVIATKFKKIAGISTVTIYGRTWSDGGGTTGYLQVDIGGQSNSSQHGGSTTPAWLNFDIDVSGLSDGTVYDVTIQLKADSNQMSYMDSIIAFGS